MMQMQMPEKDVPLTLLSPADGNEELKRSVLAMADLLGALKQASGQLTLAANHYSAGAKRFISMAARSGASDVRVAALAKVLDQRTSESSLRRLLSDKDIEKAG